MAITAFQHERRKDRWRLFALIAACAVVLALILDWPIYQLLSIKPVDPELLVDGAEGPYWATEQSQLYHFLRVVGYIPAWLAVAVGADLARWRGRDQSRRERGGAALTPSILAAMLATGLVVAFMKALIGRERPKLHDGSWDFKPIFSGFFDGSNLSTPSSHAAIAFAGAMVISRMRPGTGYIAIPLAIGCAYTRVLMGAHFISDVVLGAIVAWVVVELLLPRDRWVDRPQSVGL